MVKVMKKSFLSKALGIVFSAALMSACTLPFMNSEPDYKKGSGSARPLEVPPDLTAVSSSDSYNVPGGTSYSAYKQGQEGQEPGVEQVLRTPDGVRLEKAGLQRWLVVDAPAERVWPVVREFWLDQGFAVRVDNAELGIMETEWVKTEDVKVEDDKRGYGDRFDAWLDGLSGLADRRKFRTRLERGEQESMTEIYMSHLTVAGAKDDGKNRIQTQLGEIDTGYRRDAKTRKNDIKVDQYERDLDAELLRRLMVKLGVAEARSKEIANNPVRQLRAEVNKEADQSVTLKLNDSYARGWRRVGLALDRVGFVVEDKNRAEGLFFVRYADVDIDDRPEKKKGLFDLLFGDDEEEVKAEEQAAAKAATPDQADFWKGVGGKSDGAKRYTIKVSDAGDDGTQVNIVDADGKRNPTTTANRIVSLLYEQLK